MAPPTRSRPPIPIPVPIPLVPLPPLAKRLSRALLTVPMFLEQTGPSQLDLLQHFLGERLPNAPASLNNAIIIALDTEWYEHAPRDITELGFTVIDTKDIGPQFGPWDILNRMQVHHVRIQENAHMINKKYCPGHPNDFEFGTTRFMTKAVAAQAFLEIFSPRYADGTLKPVIFLGHAVRGDAEQLKRLLGVDMDTITNKTVTLDTQILAREAGLAAPKEQMGLSTMMDHFGVETAFLHNAGNDVAYTAVAAFLIAAESLDIALPQDNDQSLIKTLKARTRRTPQLTPGSTVFCMRCHSTTHMGTTLYKGRCYAPIRCEKCGKSLDPKRSQRVNTHITARCGYAN
jgi:hypothetical protein